METGIRLGAESRGLGSLYKRHLFVLCKEMKMVRQVKCVCYTALLLSVLVCQGAPVAELATKKALTLEVAKPS